MNKMNKSTKHCRISANNIHQTIRIIGLAGQDLITKTKAHKKESLFKIALICLQHNCIHWLEIFLTPAPKPSYVLAQKYIYIAEQYPMARRKQRILN